MTKTGIVQLAFVVEDIHAAARHWSENFGAGPFFYSPPIDINYIYRGTPTTVLASGAMGQCGGIQIELIAQHCETASLYRDIVPRGAEGLHHVARVVDDLEAAIAEQEMSGGTVASRMEFGGMRVAHCDLRPGMGFMSELMEAGTMTSALLDLTRAAAAGWDGSDPVRPLGPALEQRLLQS